MAHFSRLINKSLLGLFLILIVMIVPIEGRSSDALAQSRSISLAVPDLMAATFRDVILPGFQEANPDIYVELRTVSLELDMALQSVNTSEEYLNAMQSLASKADVLFVSSNGMIPGNTRAGYFLDISPFTSSEPTSMLEDFVPAMWDAFTWDGGQWALPLLAMPLVTIYDPTAFDAVGLEYPTESWDFDDFANTAQQLNTDDGPGMQVSSYDLPGYFHIITGQGFADTSLLAEPDFDSTELANFSESRKLGQT